MKVALCLSGQPRSYEQGFEYHKRNLLDHHDVDVYMHTWDYVPNKITIDLAKLYGGFIETEMVDEMLLARIDKDFPKIASPTFPARNTYSMWKSINRSLNMALVHSNKYDVIVRSRYDYALNIKLPLKETKVDTIFVPSDRMTEAHDFAADMFAWGTAPVMQKYAETFDNMPMFYDVGVTYIGEDMLAAQMKNHGLVGRNMAYVHMNNPFPPGEFNGNWHSIIRDDFRIWNTLR